MLFLNKSVIKKLMSKSGEQINCSILPVKILAVEINPQYFLKEEKMKNLRVLLIAFLVLGLTGVMMAGAGAAAATDEIIGGTIPFNAQWTFDAVVTNATALADADEAAYVAELIAIADIQVCSNLDANDTLSVAAKISSWTLPGDEGNFPTDGNKLTVTGTSDFSILVNGFKAVTPGLTHSGTFNAYTLLTSDDQEIIHTIPSAETAGVEDETFDIDCQVALDWLTDAPGAYAITMTLTLSQNPE